MSATLQPMNLGEILDRTFEIYRKRFWVFVGLAAMAPFATLGIRLTDILGLHISSRAHPDPGFDAFLRSIFASICYDHLRFLLSIPFVVALINSASKAAFDEPDSILSSLRMSLAHLGRYIEIGVLKLLAALIFPEMLAVGVFWGMAYAGNAAGVFRSGSNIPPIVVITVTLAVFIIFAAWLGAGFSLAFPAAELEGMTALKAIRRGWVLSRYGRWRIITVCFLILVLVWTLMSGAQILFRMAMVVLYGLLHSPQTWGNDYRAGVYAINATLIVLVGSLYPIAITLIYYDQRVRREGYDIERMMKAAGLGEAGAPGDEAASIETEPQETEV